MPLEAAIHLGIRNNRRQTQTPMVIQAEAATDDFVKQFRSTVATAEIDRFQDWF